MNRIRKESALELAEILKNNPNTRRILEEAKERGRRIEADQRRDRRRDRRKRQKRMEESFDHAQDKEEIKRPIKTFPKGSKAQRRRRDRERKKKFLKRKGLKAADFVSRGEREGSGGRGNE